MKALKDIVIGQTDAVNYYKAGDQDFLRKIYLSDDRFDDVKRKEIYFLLGDKGTGKTTYAVYSSNNETKTHKGVLKFTSETDFKKFMTLIRNKEIQVSDFVSIWKVILLLIVSQEVKSVLQENYFQKFLLYSKLDRAIETYYESAFAPEITNAIEIIDKASVFVDLLNAGKVKDETSRKIVRAGLQMNLFDIENQFKKALKGISLKKNFTLFIDGTDQIPLDLKKTDYVECLRGLANAIWDLNQFVFPTLLADSKFYLKVVLLLRPDIFYVTRFHNANAKLKDNSVILNWTTRANYWKNSRLFKLADNLFSSQQESKYAIGYSWDEYCDKYFELQIGGKLVRHESFYAIMARTFLRPRDIFAFLDIMHREAISLHSPKITSQIFGLSLMKFARYLLGEIKDQFLFFYSEDDWNILIDFFKYLEGRSRFDYEYFVERYHAYVDDFPHDNPEFFCSADYLLQELYAYNFIGYIEESYDEDFFKWAYKEKNYTNIYPLVAYEAEYVFHIGILKAIGIGKPVTRGRR